MLHNDLLVAFTVMGILFLRQIVILKRPNKINYAPLMLGIGAISSVVHFIIQPQNKDILLLIRESLFPLLFALILYVIMNILHQTQQSQTAKTQEEVHEKFQADIQVLETIQLNQTKFLDMYENFSKSFDILPQKVKTTFSNSLFTFKPVTL